jgi:hypothetical protein
LHCHEGGSDALKEFDDKQPCVVNVYVIMRALRYTITALLNASFNIPGHFMDLLQHVLTKK